MVFTGKPSKACSRCRTRKLKCDLGRPSCRKCVSAGVECHGYRNELDLIFRDQTSTTVAKCAPAPEPYDTGLNQIVHFNIVASDALFTPPPTPLKTKPLDVALAFLCTDYLRESNLEWISGMYTITSSTSLLSQVMHATALAAFAFQIDEPRLYRQARAIYQESLLGLQSTINTSEAIEDDVVASALLMSRFESLANDSAEDSITSSWASHVIGTFAIVNARSDAQNFGSTTAIALTEQAVLNYSNYCLSWGVKRPAALNRMSDQLRESFAGKPDLVVRDLRLRFHSFGNVIGDTKSYNLDDHRTHSFEAIQKVTSLDLDIQNFMSDLASITNRFESSRFDASNKGDSLYTAEGPPNHRYRDHHEARIWNSCRMVRLMVQDIIHDESRGLLQRMDISSDPKNYNIRDQLNCLHQSSILSSVRLSEDIFASSVQFLGGGETSTSHAAASSLTWPLFMAGRISKNVSGEFVKSQLSYIAKKFKVRSAQLAADNLYKKEYRDDWLVACALF